MNYKLILLLSLFGLGMAIATVYWIPSSIEPGFWLVIFLLCAYLIARNCNSKFFLHGFLLSLTNCVWITGAHIILFQTYIIHHPEEASMMSSMPTPLNPRLVMLITGIIIGIISGLIMGLFALVASRVTKQNKV